MSSPATASTAALPLGAAVDGAVRLPEWGLIEAVGEDARGFLHGQLTQDVLQLPPGAARLAGYCSAKGRLLASFVVWSPEPGRVRLACSADVLPATLKRLSMFVLRARCRLSDATPQHALWGVAGDAVRRLDLPAELLAQRTWADGEAVRLPDADGVARALWIGATPDAAPPGAEAGSASPDLWRWLEVRSGVPRIVAATADQFVPQMVNLEAVGGVSFQKGCYPGQEVVARSQYRGTLKRRARRFGVDAAAAPGDDVFSPADPDQPAGRVVLAAPAPGGGHALLCEVKSATLEPGQPALRLRAADGPTLHDHGLPYALPPQD